MQNIHNMKNTFLAISILLGLVTQAQITLTNANFAQPGDTIFYGVDTTRVSSNLATTNGTNKVWDYSSVSKQSVSESVFVSPANSPVPTPTNITHVLVENGNLEDIVFLNVNSNGVQTILPNPVPIGGGDPFLYLNSITFPLNYLTRTKDTSTSSFVLPASILQVPIFDSIRITLTINLDVLCDGWGTLKTPTGDYNSLRLKQSTITDFKFEGGLPNPLNPTRMVWTEIPLSSLPFEVPDNQLDVRYIWLSENSKYFLAEVGMVTDTPNIQEEFRYQTPRPVSTGLLKSTANNIQTTSYPNPANEVLNIEAILAHQQNYTVTLTDITGKALNSFNMVGNHQTKITLPTANLRNGLYFVRISGSDGQAIVKFCVNR
jgi:hypothetical protein